MKKNKLIMLLLLSFLFVIPANAQFDLFTDDEEDTNELESISYDDFLNGMTQVASEGEAGPVANWMSGSMNMMLDPRFANAPKEYNCAFLVKTKLLKIDAYEAVLEQLDLSCERTRKTLESYIMFMGTLYLDMFSMDFFTQKESFSYNEFENIKLGSYDAIEQFEKGKITRKDKPEWTTCQNDITDPAVTDCNSKLDEIEPYDNEEFLSKIEYILNIKKLHPVNVLSRTKDLQSLLNSLPCK